LVPILACFALLEKLINSAPAQPAGGRPAAAFSPALPPPSGRRERHPAVCRRSPAPL